MKLRIKGNSLRVRISRSELKQLLETRHVEDSIFFTSATDQRLTYALEWVDDLASIELAYRPTEIVIVLPKKTALEWATTDQVGIYHDWDIGCHGKLALIVEKDFACLDLSDADNRDTFPNPLIDAVC